MTPQLKFSETERPTSIEDLEAELGVPAATIKQAVKSENPTVRTGLIAFNEVEIDERVQRPLDEILVNKIAKKFNERALGAVTISVREQDGVERYILLDGQQRMNGAARAGFKGRVRAIFFYGLTLQQEAEMFRELNTKHSVSAFHKFRVALTEELPGPVAIKAILDEMNVPLSTNLGFSAVSVAERVAKLQGGPDSFRWALKVIHEVYGRDTPRQIYNGVVVEALALLHNTFGNQIDTKRLVEKLLTKGSGVAGVNFIVGQGRTNRSVDKGSLVPNVMNAYINVYNLGLHRNSANALPKVQTRK
jgi:hypothetical protein